MPLSEEELRLLEQMERALVADDPKLASTMRGASIRRHARRRAYVAAGAFLVGIAVLMTGAVMSMTVVGIVGFVVMLGSAYVALVSWRGQSGPEPVAAAVEPDSPFTLIEGGRKSRRPGRGHGRSAPQHGSFMERMEERWRRRREQNGGM
ncbi:MAG TPA: DUF3040 domain-containing protein [Nocardioides sp.]|nr:DUF3040 domain-containing protein [Nocardioides sp.]